MRVRGSLTISDGQDRIFMVCQKLEDFMSFLNHASDDDHISITSLRDKCSELQFWADPLHAHLESIEHHLESKIDSDIQVEIESIENVMRVLEDKLTEVMMEKGPEYLKEVFQDAQVF